MTRRKENIIAEYCKRKVTLKASDWKCLCETSIFISLAKESLMDNFDVSGVEKNKPCIGRGSENFGQSYNLPQGQVHPQRKGLDALVWLNWRNLNTDCWQLRSAETYKSLQHPNYSDVCLQSSLGACDPSVNTVSSRDLYASGMPTCLLLQHFPGHWVEIVVSRTQVWTYVTSFNEQVKAFWKNPSIILLMLYMEQERPVQFEYPNCWGLFSEEKLPF